MTMKKTDIILQIAIVLVLLGAWRLYHVKVQKPKMRLLTKNSEELKRNEFRDGFSLWYGKMNREKGTNGLVYFPCPLGYDCEKLPPPRYREQGGEIHFVQCEGTTDCMEVLEWVLTIYGVDNIASYLSNKKYEAK